MKNRTDEDFLKISKYLAKKFKSPQHYEDLVSEGVIAALELEKESPNCTSIKVFQVVSKAQWNFLNVKNQTVSIPEALVRTIKLGHSEKWDHGYSKETLDWAGVVLSGKRSSVELLGIEGVSEQAAGYEEEETLKLIWDSAVECLSEEEFYVYYRLYFLGEKLSNIAKDLEVTPNALRKRLGKMNALVRKRCNNKKAFCNKK